MQSIFSQIVRCLWMTTLVGANYKTYYCDVQLWKQEWVAEYILEQILEPSPIEDIFDSPCACLSIILQCCCWISLSIEADHLLIQCYLLFSSWHEDIDTGWCSVLCHAQVKKTVVDTSDPLLVFINAMILPTKKMNRCYRMKCQFCYYREDSLQFVWTGIYAIYSFCMLLENLHYQ